ncbi:N-succinyldiaminopimelate aminotransferase [Gammaproteobacteria bacterium]
MNTDLNLLQPYPFQRLSQLIAGIIPAADLSPIKLSIGEPRHTAPPFIARTWMEHQGGLSQYPVTRGSLALRMAIAAWLTQRFSLATGSLDPERHCLPVAGTREALFAFAQCVVERGRDSLVLMPNPFYQIYEGAALLAGAQPWFLNTTQETGFLPDFDAVPEEVWKRCRLLYVCSPGNPTGAVLDTAAYTRLIDLADRYDFVIAADECYSEIYNDENSPPPGLLQICAALGRNDFRRCMVFHSLSKRSNVPGLRSGFVAGDAAILERFFLYRTYHGCALPPPTQAASTAAWADEAHVIENRALYRHKFAAVLEILGEELEVSAPAGGFYLWPKVSTDAETFARNLYAATNVLVLPGSYLSRFAHGTNPGHDRVRIALVAPLEECLEAAQRIRNFVKDQIDSKKPKE